MMELRTKKSKDEGFKDWIRKFYDNKAKTTAKGDYEQFRWFSNTKKARQYNQTTKSLIFHFKDIDFKDCLDIGCGPGTWTRLLLKIYPQAKFTCIDISDEMIAQFKIEDKDKKRVKKIISAFNDYPITKKYDFIFSSRAIEYMPDKPFVIQKMYNLLKPNGRGMVVTSPPHPFILSIKTLLGKKINLQHTQRISVKDMKLLLKKAGFKNITFYPILFADALPEFINKFLFQKFYKKKWNIISRMFASGYIVKFEKL